MRKKIYNQYTREIEVKGHLIDSMILTKIFDRVMDLKGDFEVKEFVIGSGKKDYSYAKLLIAGKNKFLHRHRFTPIQRRYRRFYCSYKYAC